MAGGAQHQWTIGFLAPNIHGYVFGSLLAGVLDAAADHRARVVAIQALDAGISDSKNEPFAAPVAWRQLDALVVTQAAVGHAYLEAFAATGKPVVTICQEPGDFQCPMVVPDNDQGVRAAVDHLIGHGHDAIAFVGRDPANADDWIRYRVYRETMSRHGLQPWEAVLVPWQLGETYQGAAALQRLRERGPLPTAVVACTDATAMALIEAFATAGISVPGDVAVIGFDDISEASRFTPPLSTVAQSFPLAGATAARLAIDALRGRQAEPGFHCTPVTLVIRQSCGCQPGEAAPAGAPDAGAAPVGSLGGAPLDDHRGGHGPAVVNEHVEIQRRYYMISTELVRYDRDLCSLDWLRGTEVRRGCLALREDGRGNRGGAGVPWLVGTCGDGAGVPRTVGTRGDNAGVLRIVGTYGDGARPAPRAGEACPVEAFPPLSFIDGNDEHPGDLMFVLPVRFSGSDWGLLALAGPFDAREETVFERFNHWAVLLTVSLDQRQAMRSERALLEEIRASEQRYAIVAEAANDGLWDWDSGTGTVYYSGRWKALLGYADDAIDATPEEWLGRIHPDDRPAVEPVIAAHLAGRESGMQLEYRLLAADGTYRWMLTHGRAMRNDAGEVVRLVGSMTDITDRKRVEEQLRRDAHYDLLTGLPNRTLFLDRLSTTITRSAKACGHVFAVVFLDLDGFKNINDSLGHQVGDEVLVQVARRLTSQVRVGDTVSRFGGDEFVLLLDEVADAAEVRAIVRRVLSAVAAPLTLASQHRAVSAAAGIAVSTAGHRTADEYLRDADTAMYRAKAIGPGAVVVFNESMNASSVVRLRLETDLARALVDNQFELHYQPVLRLADRRTVGLESLIRWRHPELGPVPPSEFLPIADASCQASEIGEWTIRAACRQLRAWMDAAASWGGVTVSVNLSNRQFWDPELQSAAYRALAEFDIPPSALVLEVTEGVIGHNQELARRLLRQLHDYSIRLHVDDFGTGSASLSVLHGFPIDAVKIDRSFIAGMGTDEHSRELVRTVIAAGANLGIGVIAEGIEREEEAEMLVDLGCPLGQGYLFGRPISADAVPPLLLGSEPETPPGVTAGPIVRGAVRQFTV